MVTSPRLQHGAAVDALARSREEEDGVMLGGSGEDGKSISVCLISLVNEDLAIGLRQASRSSSALTPRFLLLNSNS